MGQDLPRPEFRMRLQILLCLTNHLLFTSVGQLTRSPFERNPERALYLDAHFRCDVINLPALVEEEVKADHLEDARSFCPRSNIHVLDIAELRYRRPRDPGPLDGLASCRLLGLFPPIDQSLAQSQ